VNKNDCNKDNADDLMIGWSFTITTVVKTVRLWTYWTFKKVKVGTEHENREF